MSVPRPAANLIVLRSRNIDRAAHFYRELGLEFTKHSHGSGPEHYASEAGPVVFEIYPLVDSLAPTTSARVGFSVWSVDAVLTKLREAGAEVVSQPKDSPWGRRAVVRDLDGHTVELVTASDSEHHTAASPAWCLGLQLERLVVRVAEHLLVDPMKTLTFILAVCCFALSAHSQTDEPPAIVRTLLDQQMKSASSDFAAACICLTRDVQDKRLTVYAVVSTAKMGVTNEAGFTIRVTYHSALEENYLKSSGSFIQHYNSCLLDFALAQYVEGRKALGLQLVRLLAEAAPETSWSSMRIKPTNIEKILAALERDDSKLADMMKEAVRDWHQRERDYKP